jgi:MFS family permease
LISSNRLWDWLVVLLLAAAAIFSFLDRFVLSLLVEPIKADLGLSDAQIGLLHGVAFGLFYALLQVPLGWLADRWSRPGTIVIGIAIWSVATACCGFAKNFPQLLLARIGVGAGEAALTPASYALIHDRFASGPVNLALGIFTVGGFFGAGLAMLFSGLIYGFFEQGGGTAFPYIGDLKPWQQTFVVAALPGIFFVVALAFVRDPRRVRPGAAERISDRAPAEKLPPLSIYTLLFVGMAGQLSCSYALMSWLPAIFARELQWSAEQIGWNYGLTLLIAAPAGVLAGSICTDWLRRRGQCTPETVMPLAAAAFALPLVVLFGATDGSGLQWVAGALHFVLGLPMGVAPALIQRITPQHRRSFVSGIYVLACNAIGLGLAPLAIGGLSSLSPDDPTALRSAISSTLIVCTIGSIVLLLLLRRILRRPDTNEPRPSSIDAHQQA